MDSATSSRTITSWHSAFDDGVRWRLVDDGVEIEDSGVERTKGKPATVEGVWRRYADDINLSSRKYQMPCELLIATICTESGGDSTAVRLEPGYVSDAETPNKVSPGLMQTLISTARDALQLSLDRDWLLKPVNSIRAGAAYIDRQSRNTELDPPRVAAAYNAGRIAHNTGAKNRWKMRQYPIGTGAHCDRFVRFYNDAVSVLSSAAVRPVRDHQSLLRQ